MFKLSPSSLSLMGECPRCFWLTQHKVWQRPQGIFPSLPSGMDNILKKHFDKFMRKNERFCCNKKIDKDLVRQFEEGLEDLLGRLRRVA